MTGPFMAHHAGCALAAEDYHHCVPVHPGGDLDDGCACPDCTAASDVRIERIDRMYRYAPPARRRKVVELPFMVPAVGTIQ